MNKAVLAILRNREEPPADREIIDALGKEFELPPKCVDARSRGYDNFVSCRRCGHAVSEAGYNYCPGCGQRIKKYIYAGTQGWSHKEAEAAWRKVREEALR